MKCAGFLAVVGIALLNGAASAADPDQFYKEWRYSDAKGYYYCEYYYKSNAGDVAFKQQYVIFNPKDPNWLYWCNPVDNPDNKSGEAKFWARCPSRVNPKFGKLVKEGKDIWSVLPNDKKKARLGDLKDSDFPEAKEIAQPIPGSKDPKRTIPCPPDPPNLPD